MALIEISELHTGVLQLTFNRPDKLNALSTPLMAEFDAALDAAAEDPNVRVLVLRGAGGKAFVAGADIAEYQGDKRAEFIAYQMNSRRVFDKLERLPKTVICAIDGFALAEVLKSPFAVIFFWCQKRRNWACPKAVWVCHPVVAAPSDWCVLWANMPRPT